MYISKWSKQKVNIDLNNMNIQANLSKGLLYICAKTHATIKNFSFSHNYGILIILFHPLKLMLNGHFFINFHYVGKKLLQLAFANNLGGKFYNWFPANFSITSCLFQPVCYTFWNDRNNSMGNNIALDTFITTSISEGYCERTMLPEGASSCL